jgi:hypothetical protein
MRWRIETGMGVIAPLWHTIAFPASYIIYGNALDVAVTRWNLLVTAI